MRQEDLEALRLPFGIDPAQISAIVCMEMFDWDYDKMLCELGLPILFIDGPVRTGACSLPADQLYMDNSSEIGRLVSGMLERGIRKTGFVGDYMHCQSFHERYLGVYCTLLMQGIPVEDRFIIHRLAVSSLSAGFLFYTFLCFNRPVLALPWLIGERTDFEPYYRSIIKTASQSPHREGGVFL